MATQAGVASLLVCQALPVLGSVPGSGHAQEEPGAIPPLEWGTGRWSGGGDTSVGHFHAISVDAEGIRVPRPGEVRRELPSRGISVRKNSVKQQAKGLSIPGDSEGFVDKTPT